MWSPETCYTRKPLFPVLGQQQYSAQHFFSFCVRVSSPCRALNLKKKRYFLSCGRTQTFLSRLLDVVMASVWLGRDDLSGNESPVWPRDWGLRQCLWVPWKGKVAGCEKNYFCPTPLISKSSDCIFCLSGSSIAQKVTEGHRAVLVQEKGAVTLDCRYDSR